MTAIKNALLRTHISEKPKETPNKFLQMLIDLIKSIFLSSNEIPKSLSNKEITPHQPTSLEKERKKASEMVIKILTAKEEKGIPWAVQLRKRKTAACQVLAAFNETAKPEYRFGEITFLNIHNLLFSYEELCMNKDLILNPYRRRH